MPDNQNINTNNPVNNPVVVTSTPTPPPSPEENNNDEAPAANSIMADVAAKINDAHNILIALSSDPTVDELSAAIGLSLCLDRTGKRATAIYSGATPNALEFLKPTDTFETSADTLQDFVIAINKEKADHLRYKLDGDYVKIFITPYKTRIDEEDLEFSYGDFNIDLVLALDVANGVDLDSALREHGRIMHDATVVNITTGNPGKFGEIEWSDLKSSSVSEMAARLLYSMERKLTIESDEATALLTGIIAATDRFSNSSTTPETLQIASRLMESGADQQLVVENISSGFDNTLFNLSDSPKLGSADDSTSLDIEHDEEENEKTTEVKNDEAPVEEPKEHPADEPKEPDAKSVKSPETPAAPEPSADSELKAVEDSLKDTPEKVLAPSSDFLAETSGETNKYGQMLEDALKEADAASQTSVTPEMSAPAITPGDNPAASLAPDVAAKPEINGVPEINYMPLPGDEVLPPPPTPPISDEPTFSLPTTDEAPSKPEVAQPSMQDQVYTPQASDPSAFKIPGIV